MSNTVISLVPFLIEEQKPGLVPGKFVITPAKNNVPKVLIVEDSFYFVYIDADRKPMKQTSVSHEVARSIVEDYCNAQLGIEEGVGPALFHVAGVHTVADVQVDFADEIEAAIAKQKRWFINICQIADNDWQRYHQHNVISQFQREAAEIIGWRAAEHPWMSPMTTMDAQPCPACSLSNVKGTVICSNCKCILMAEEYKKLQFA